MSKFFALALLVLTSVALSSSLDAQTYPLGQQTTGLTGPNSSSCNMGYNFTANAAGMTVIRLGNYTATTTAKTVTLYNKATQAVLGQVVCPAGTGWQWADLSTPVPLTNGTEYAVAVQSNSWHYTDITK